MKRFNQFIVGCLLGTISVTPLLADDIDIFYSSSNRDNVDTLVMFVLDWRPNFYSTMCNGECPEYRSVLGSYLTCDGEICDPIRRYDLFRAALKKVLSEINSHGDIGIKVGILMNHHHFAEDGPVCDGYQSGASAEKCSNGGYILQDFVSIYPENGDGWNAFFSKLDALPNPSGGESHKFQGAETYFEFFRYLTGQDIHNAKNGWWDFGTNDDYNIDSINDADSGGVAVSDRKMMWDEAALDGTGIVYDSPLIGIGECSAVFTLNFMHQVSQQDSDSDDAIKATKADRGMEGIGKNPNFPDVLKYLHDVDLADGSFKPAVDLEGKTNVTSYFVVDPTKINTTTNGYAKAGGTGQAIASSDAPSELISLIGNLFQSILAQSSTFVSTAVAANTQNRAQTREELFLALFEPDEDNNPWWDGNVKKLKFRTIDVPVVDENGDPVLDDNGNPLTVEKRVLVDANNNDAVNALDGRIAAEALTFWTDSTALTPNLPPPDNDPDFTDTTDGREVPRGGVGQRVPGFLPDRNPGFTNSAGRNMFTEPAIFTNGSATTLMSFEANDTTAIDLLTNDPVLYETVMDCTACTYAGETDPTRQTEAENKTINMIKFSRGYDVPFDATDYGNPDGRAWWIGAPLHSRPLILNYGKRGSYTLDQPDIRVVAAGNGGMLHMFKDANPDGSENGSESWSFLPRKFIPAQRRFMENVKGAHQPGILASPPRLSAFPYLLDSSATALVIDNNLDGTIDTGADDKVYIYICMRRGGKGCYALDVSDPDDPKLLWTIDKSHTGFSEMGQSWSLMRAGLIAYKTDNGNVVQTAGLFFSAGYNGDDHNDGAADGAGTDGVSALGKDSRVKNHNNGTEILGSDDYEGNGVFVVDARDGSLIWKAVGPASASDNASGWNSTDLMLKVPAMVDSMPADVFLFDSDGDSLTDRFYIADSGGVLWRGDIVPGDRANWTMTRVLSVGRHFTASNDNDRRFFSRVDVAKARDPDGFQGLIGEPFDAVVLVSGDRANPLGTVVEDWVYMFKDKNTTSGAPPSTLVTHDELQDLTDNCLQDGNNADCTDQPVNGVLPKLDKGWKVRLNHCGDANLSTGTACGEKGLSSPLIISGNVFFTTYLPNTTNGSLCELPQGRGLFYVVNLHDAAAVFDFNAANNNGEVVLDRFDDLTSPGIPPSPVAIAADMVLRPDLELHPVNQPPDGATFWYEHYIK